ncbi:MAG TPA: protein phosphatase 2C domain-containing protein [Ktedonobacterales bacterium]|nr:protein phosphatase 2C domain-containing protein [Ktedonobacterales bacterium]
MLCPNCNHPLRDQAKFCNNCGITLAAAFVPAGAAPAAPLAAEPGKAEPTGPLHHPPAIVADDAAQTPEEPAASEPAFLGAGDEEQAQPIPPPPPAPDAQALETEPTLSAGDQPEEGMMWYQDTDQEGAGEVVATEQLYGLDPYAPSGGSLSMDTPENNQADESLSADDVPTVRMPRPARNEVEVTAELLDTLGSQTPLQPGMLLEGRYLVEEVVHTDEDENLYRVTDQMGYLHCWACNTDFPDTQQPERFCSNCGADMLGKDYWLRERLQGAAAEASQPEAESASEASSAYVDTDAQSAFAASDAPGTNGAHPEGAADEAALLQEDAESDEQDWPTQPMTAIASFIVGPRHYRVEAMEIEDPIFPLGVTLVAGARSDVGRTRRGNPNEDSILVMEFTRIHESANQSFGLYIVADGLGGHDDGQTASRRAIGVMADYITREVVLPALQSGQYADNETVAAKLKASVEAANLALVGSNEQTGSDMGSTVTGALVIGDTAHIVNVGDSRTYFFDTVSLQPISVDHSLVMQLVIGGLIERDDIYTHPQRNQILRSLGDRRDVQIDLFTQKLRPGYQLVICCDGLWEMIRDPQIEQVLRSVSDPQAAADRLMELANENGGEDNISVIVVQARE